jgi:hypothetical protein
LIKIEHEVSIGFSTVKNETDGVGKKWNQGEQKKKLGVLIFFWKGNPLQAYGNNP